jgi:hypothetical protein
MLYEIINPSDPYHFECNDLEVAAIMIGILGEGHYAAQPLDENGNEIETEVYIPLFLFGSADTWFKKQFGITMDESMGHVLKDRKSELIEAFESVTLGSFKDRKFVIDALNAIDDPVKKEAFKKKWIEEKQTSLNDIGGRADALARSLKKKISK